MWSMLADFGRAKASYGGSPTAPSMEHQYIVTDDIPEIYGLKRTSPRYGSGRESYLRQEGLDCASGLRATAALGR